MSCLRIGLLSIAVMILGCDPQPDPRFATPQDTVTTMFVVYGVDAMTEQQVQKHMKAKQKFQLQDRKQYLECFSDFKNPSDEGMAGYVFGRLAAAKDSLRYKTTAGRTTVRTSQGQQIVLTKSANHEWKIKLRDSVPLNTQKQLHAVYKRAQKNFRPL